MRESFNTNFSLLDKRAVSLNKWYVFEDKGLVVDFYMCGSG